MSCKIKHFFISGNTSESCGLFLNSIADQKASSKIFLLKSKSILLKSFLIKDIGEYFIKNGYNMEYYHCPYDENLLYGIIIKELNIVLLNGDLLKDPGFPLCYEIFDLDKDLDKTGFKRYIKKEIHITAKIKSTLNRCCKFIKTAKLVQEDWKYCNESAVDNSKLNTTIEDLKLKILSGIKTEACGKSRHLFATALTKNGIMSFIKSLYDENGIVYVLNGHPGTGKTTVLKSIYKEALKKGLYVEIYHHPLLAHKLEHIVIPELNTALISSNEINRTQFNGMQIYMDNLIDYGKINRTDLKEDKKIFYLLLDKSLSIMSENKKLPYDLQNYFSENISSDSLDIICKNILSRLK